MTLQHQRFDSLDLTGPRCHGPMLVDQTQVRCEAGHAFSTAQLLYEAHQAAATAVWEAVRAVENRDRVARWALHDPALPIRQWLTGSAAAGGETSQLLRFYAGAIDATTARLQPPSPAGPPAAPVVPLRGPTGPATA